METPVPQELESNINIKAGVKRWAMQMIISLVLFGAFLFLLAGKITWPAGWVYLAIYALTHLMSAVVLIPRQGGILAERSKVREGTKDWDRILAPAIVVVGTLAVLSTAALDARFGWCQPVSNGL